MQRRHVIRTLGATTAAALLPALPAFAQGEAGARTLIDRLATEISGIMASGKSAGAMYGDFERILRRYGDVPTMAAYALGVDGRAASAPQQRAFQDAFVGYLSRKYGAQFRTFEGGRMAVDGVRRVKSRYEVAASIHGPAGATVPVIFMVSDRGGRMRVVNIKIDGGNLLLTERTEVGVMIDRHGGDIDAVTRDLGGAG